MKNTFDIGWLGSGFLAVALTAAWLGAAEPRNGKQVRIKEGKPVIRENGETHPLKKNLDLTPLIRVYTNGTFTVNQGKSRKLAEGEILDEQGMLTKPNGTVQPVVDHLTMNRGRVILVQDGRESALEKDMFLPGGVRVAPDGVMKLPDGRLRRMIDGQMLKLDGSVVPARDTVTKREGQVWVQKDGAQFAIRQSQTIMMNDGTKVFGDGTVVQKDGKTILLSEGQILPVEGIAFKQR